MKVVFVLPHVVICGGVRAVFELSNRLVARGHDVTIIYPLVQLETASKLSLKNKLSLLKQFLVNLILRRKIAWFPVKAKVVRTPFMHSRLVGAFEWMLPDADIIFATAWQTVPTVKKLKPIKGKKAYFVQHYEVVELWDSDECWGQALKIDADPRNIFLAMAAIEPKDERLKAIKQMVDDTFLSGLSMVTTSIPLEQLIVKHFKQKCYGRVPIGLNLDDFYPQGKKADGRVILMPFRGEGWKGGLDGLRAMEMVRERYPDVKVIMFGPRQFKRFIPDWIDFKGTIYGEALRRAYSYADVFASPTWVEGWSCPQMEAMACRTACVTTDVGAVPDYAVANETAVIVPPRSPENLAKAVLELLLDKGRRDMIAQKGYDHIREYKNTWEYSVDLLEGVLKKIFQN